MDPKDLEAKGQLYHVGARFEALFMGVLTAVSNLGCIFFRILISGLEQMCSVNVWDLSRYLLYTLVNHTMGMFNVSVKNAKPTTMQSFWSFSWFDIYFVKQSFPAVSKAISHRE